MWKCPKCGADTEVYSRITGYYRPVKNWNAGKTQEFKDRRTYQVMGSQPKSADRTMIFNEQKEAHSPKEEKGDSQALLFTTKTCPNCSMIKEVLNRNNFDYQTIDAEEHSDLAKKYGILQAPTLVMVHEDHADKYANASNIMRYISHTHQA